MASDIRLLSVCFAQTEGHEAQGKIALVINHNDGSSEGLEYPFLLPSPEPEMTLEEWAKDVLVEIIAQL